MRERLASFRDKAAVPLFATAFVFGIVTAIYWTYAVDFLIKQNKSQSSAIAFWIFIGVAGIPGCFAGRLVNAAGLRVSFQAIVFCVALAIGSLPIFAGAASGLYASAFFFGAGFIAATAGFGIWSTRLFRAAPSIGLAATFFLLSLGQVAGPVLGGVLSPMIGQAALFEIAGLVCGCLVCFGPRV